MFDHINLLSDSVLRDCGAFLPELVLCASIVILLLLRMMPSLERWHLGWVALVLTGVALAVSVAQWSGGVGGILTPEEFRQEKAVAEFEQPIALSRPSDLFSGMLVYDYFTVFMRIFLFSFTLLVIWLSLITGIPDREDAADFYTLLLGATVGMSLMASTNHLLMVFIGVEMASLPSYALAGYLKGRRLSSEAALKYVVYGGGAAGVMLYGISLLAGKFGTAYLPELARAYLLSLSQPVAAGLPFDPLLLLGTLFIVIGIGFKIAAVPFHFWCPDVFEGASAEVAGFLSVASKGAALALLARVALTLGGLGTIAVPVPPLSDRALDVLVPALSVLAIVTATFGNLAAYRQTNLKRLLAYSTIAHAGYMMMGLAVISRDGTRAVLFYLIAYLLMNLGAFAVVAFLRNQTGSEELDSYRGLVRRSPWMVVTLSIFLLSLLGIPPLAGFVGKFQVFAAVWQGAQRYAANEAGLSTWLYAVLAFGLLNSVLSAFFYVKVMKVMILDERVEDVEGQEPRPLPEPAACVAYAGLLAAAVFVAGILWGPLEQATAKGVRATSSGGGTRVVEGTRGGQP